MPVSSPPVGSSSPLVGSFGSPPVGVAVGVDAGIATGAAPIGPVGSLVRVSVPVSLEAVTTTRTTWPTSAPVVA